MANKGGEIIEARGNGGREELLNKLRSTLAAGEVPHPFAFVVPGGNMPTIRAMGNEAIRAYVRSAAETAEVVGSVCTGALILASVGLLEGRRATTHWAFYKILNSSGRPTCASGGWRTADSSAPPGSPRG